MIKKIKTKTKRKDDTTKKKKYSETSIKRAAFLADTLY